CRVVAAIGGKSLFDGVVLFPSSASPQRRQVRIGARGVTATVDGLKLYRDVYYTPAMARHAVDKPIHLGEQEFFLLGDNSPLSNDGRHWPVGATAQKYL